MNLPIRYNLLHPASRSQQVSPEAQSSMMKRATSACVILPCGCSVDGGHPPCIPEIRFPRAPARQPGNASRKHPSDRRLRASAHRNPAPHYAIVVFKPSQHSTLTEQAEAPSPHQCANNQSAGIYGPAWQAPNGFAAIPATAIAPCPL